jgi:hypothetical protein
MALDVTRAVAETFPKLAGEAVHVREREPKRNSKIADASLPN